MLFGKRKFCIEIPMDFRCCRIRRKGKLESLLMETKNDLISVSQRFYKKKMDSQTNSRPTCTCKEPQLVAQMQYVRNQDEERYGEQSECPRCRWAAEKGEKGEDLCECDSDLVGEVIRRRDSQEKSEEFEGEEFVERVKKERRA